MGRSRALWAITFVSISAYYEASLCEFVIPSEIHFVEHSAGIKARLPSELPDERRRGRCYDYGARETWMFVEHTCLDEAFSRSCS